MAKPIRLLIDGDWIIYAAGFAGQKTRYVYQCGDGVWTEVDNVSHAKAICETGNWEFDPARLYSRIELDELSHVLHSAKKMIEGVVKAAQKKFPGAEIEYVVYVDGDGNFRSRLGTIRPYKGNRRPDAKPIRYNEIRQYLIDRHGANVVHNIETDDRLAIEATRLAEAGQRAVIVAVDKDLLQVPGIHYIPNKGQWKKVTPEVGLKRLYAQAAMGDPVDNIAGCFKVGKKRALAVFRDTEYDTEEQMWHALVQLYDESMQKYGSDLYGGLTAEEAALESMRLVYLLRYDGDFWSPQWSNDDD